MSGQPQTCKEPISREIVEQATQLCERAENLSARLAKKLEPVLTPTPPRLNGGTPDKIAITYPPLFSELRGIFERIREHFSDIDELLSRTEL